MSETLVRLERGLKQLSKPFQRKSKLLLLNHPVLRPCASRSALSCIASSQPHCQHRGQSLPAVVQVAPGDDGKENGGDLLLGSHAGLDRSTVVQPFSSSFKLTQDEWFACAVIAFTRHSQTKITFFQSTQILISNTYY